MTEKPASARSLFRATGNKPKARERLLNLLGEIVTARALEREPDDFYPTPPEPCGHSCTRR